MKRAILLTVAAAVFGFSMPTAAQETKTVTGELIELNCYLKNKDVTTDSYKGCAEISARRGSTLGILSGETVYIVKGDLTKNNNEKLLPSLTKIISATGDVRDVNGKMMISVTDFQAAK